jgi:predicted cupin superfamily sugar epimerase
MMLTAAQIVAKLGLAPHPEGGAYRETFRHTHADGTRGAMTAIYYLLRDGEVSHWHRVDAAEIWHYYAGAPLELALSADGKARTTQILGPAIDKGEAPQILVPDSHWQSARSLGAWTLVGCTVGPAFDFAGFEMAPPGWAPGL